MGRPCYILPRHVANSTVAPLLLNDERYEDSVPWIVVGARTQAIVTSWLHGGRYTAGLVERETSDYASRCKKPSLMMHSIHSQFNVVCSHEAHEHKKRD
jgi:hypothetical protein